MSSTIDEEEEDEQAGGVGLNPRETSGYAPDAEGGVSLAEDFQGLALTQSTRHETRAERHARKKAEHAEKKRDRERR